MGLLTGKTALVTGAARGIGKAVAMKFAQEGANIAFTDLVLNDDMAAGLEATRKEIEALGVTRNHPDKKRYPAFRSPVRQSVGQTLQ